MKKSYLIGILDDHSRLIVHAEFYLSERLNCYLDCLESALLKRGLPRKLYVDNGAAFRSRHLEHVTASLGIALIHATPYQPQGKGKIERFHRTVRSDFLSGFKGKTFRDLNETFDFWLNQIYHQRKHSSTGQSPFERFTSRMECMRVAPPNLKDYFRQTARRKVAKDRTFTLNGKIYEAPVALIGEQITLLYHVDSTDQVEIRHKETSYGMVAAVDLNVNCRAKREKKQGTIITADTYKYSGGGLFTGEDNNESGVS